MKTKQALATLVLIILFILCCLQGSASGTNWDWLKRHQDWKLQCRVLVTSKDITGWKEFIVNYLTSHIFGRFSPEVITYKCSKNKLFDPSSYKCEWSDYDLYKGFPEFSPKASLEIDLKPGTEDAQEEICKRIFNKCKKDD